MNLLNNIRQCHLKPLTFVLIYITIIEQEFALFKYQHNRLTEPCFKIEVLEPEVMRIFHDSIQRGQLELITIDQLVPPNHLVRKMEAAIDFTFIYDLLKDMYS
ncbi:hypothetical protein [Peribacillus frigoritolerans]|uniref:hypothetical protein n=1 Tax=Peribacillus frigoritolerans TaxID=450367 RepID=UPI0025A2B9FE|nr:hypothetical protein [Peribacillus frigoritolerans]MDM5313965.1 hypothetical protein [Peribacillus frigoritolerans]